MNRINHHKNSILLSGLVFSAGFLFFSSVSVLYAQTYAGGTDAWEPDQIKPVYSQVSKESSDIFTGDDTGITLILFYQKAINVNSISRCPFYISCSNFAILAIRKHGFLPGMLLFIDRIFFRENPDSHRFYKLKRNSQLNLKLDDYFFLYGELPNEFFIK